MTAFEEHAPALQRVGTPVEPHRGALEGASPVDARTATPPAALRASESFASLDPVEEAAVLRAQQEEEPPVEAMTAFEEHAPALQRVGTPVEPHRGALEGASPVDARTATPPAALRASESFASLDPVEEAAVLRAQQEEEPPVEAMTAFEEHAPALQRVGTPVEPHRGALEGASPVDARTATPPAALRASESFASLDPVEEAAVLRAQQEEEPPVEAMTAFEEHAPALQRVGTPVEPHRGALEGASPVDARTATPPAALRASESFASLDPVEEAAVLRAQQEEEPPVEAMTAFEEYAPALQRVGTPVEPQPRLAVTTHRVRLDGDLWARVVDEWPDLLKQEFTSDVCDATALPRTSMQRLVLTAGSLVADFQLSHGGLAKRELDKQLASSPFTRTWALYERVAETKETPPTRATPPAALRASESFASLDPVEEAAVLRAQQEEEPPVEAMTAFEEHAPALQRVGTPVEPHRGALEGASPVDARTATPPAALRASESFASLDPVEEAAVLRAQQEEEPPVEAMTAFEEHAPALQRVGTPVEPHRGALEGASPVDARTATPPAALRASESVASLDPVEEAAVLRAQQEEEPPVEAMTAFEEHAPALQRVGTPVEPHRGALEGASPVDARTATPPAALRASDSFASLDPVEEAAVLRAQQEDEAPAAERAAEPQEAPMAASTEVPPARELWQSVAEPEGYSRDDLGCAEPAALHALAEDEAPAAERAAEPQEAPMAASTEVPPARELWQSVAEPEGYSRDDLGCAEPAALHALAEDEAPAAERAAEPQEAPMAASTEVPPARELWQSVAEPEGYSRDDLGCAEPAALHALTEDEAPAAERAAEPQEAPMAASTEVPPARELWQSVAELEGYSRDDLGCAEPAALHALAEDEAPAAERAAEPQEAPMAASTEVPPARELWQSVAEPEGYSRDDLGCAEPAALHALAEDEAPAAERAAEPQEAPMAASTEVPPARELWQSVAEPEGYSRDDLGCAEPAALHALAEDEAPAAERAAEPQEAPMAASTEVPPARELWQSVAEPEGYSRDDLGCAEPAALHALTEDEAPAAERAAEPQEAPMAASTEVPPARELWQSVAEPEGYSRDDLGCAEPAALHALAEDEAPAAERAAEPQEAPMAASTEVPPARELWQSVAEPEGYSRDDLGCAEPAALHALAEDEAPAAERAAEPQEAPMAASTEVPPARKLWQSVAEPEGYSRDDLGCAEPAALHALAEDEAPAAERAAEPQEAPMAASTEVPPARELWQSVAEPEGYSRDDLGCAEPAALHALAEDEAPAAERAAEPQEAPMAASTEVPPARELWQSVAEPEGYSRDDLGCAEPAALHALAEDEAPAAERAAEPQEAPMAASTEVPPARKLWQSVAEPEGYSRDDLGCAEPAALHALAEDEAPAAERAAEPQEAPMAASTEVPPARELWQSVAEPEGYSRDDLGCAEPAALHALAEDEAPAAERAAEPQEAPMAASTEVPPARELWQPVAEPEGYSRDDLGCAEPAALHALAEDEAPAAERAAEPQEAPMAASTEVPPARELWQSVAEPEGYSRDDLGCAEPAALHALAEDEAPAAERAAEPQEAPMAASTEVPPARELWQPVAEPEGYSRDDLGCAEPAALHALAEDEAPAAERAAEPQEAPMAASTEVPPARELWQSVAEPEGYSRDDLGCAEPAALHALAEDEAPAAERAAEPQEAPMAASTEVPPARELWQSVAVPEGYSRDDLGCAEPAALHALAEDEAPAAERAAEPQEAPMAASTEVPPARKLWQSVAEPEGYSRDDLGCAEPAALHALAEDEAPAAERAAEPQEAPMAASTEVPPARELWQSVAEPEGYSRDDLGCAEPAALHALAEDEAPAAERAAEPQEAPMAASTEVPPARELWQSVAEPEGYSRDDLGCAEPAALHALAEDEAPAAERAAEPQEAPMAASTEVPPARELWQSVAVPEGYSRDDLGCAEPAALHALAEDEAPAAERAAEPQEAPMAASTEVPPARKLWQSVAEPEGYSRDDLGCAEPAALHALAEDEAPAAERAAEPQEAPMAASTEVPPARELWQSVAEPEGYSRDDLGCAEPAALHALAEDEAPAAERAAEPQEAPMAASTEVPPARELWQSVAEPEGYSRDDLGCAEPAALHALAEDEAPAAERAAEPQESRIIRMNEVREVAGREEDAKFTCLRTSFSPGCSCPGSSGLLESPSRSVVGMQVVDGKSLKPRVTQHKVKLQGRYWAKVISLPCVVEAFRQDVAHALDVRVADIQHVELVAGSLSGTFVVVHAFDLLTATEADDKLRAYHFPLTWEHYPKTPDTTTGHFFEAEALSTIRRTSRCINSASKSRLPPADMELSRPTPAALKPHPPLWAAQEVSQSTLSSGGRTCSATIRTPAVRESLPVGPAVHGAPPLIEKRTWASNLPSSKERHYAGDDGSESSMKFLQETALAPVAKAVRAPAVPETVSTKHRVGFVGNQWSTILKTQRDDFVAAFVKGTGEKLGYEPDSVTKVQCDESTGDTIVSFSVTHPSVLPRKQIDLVLRSAPYADVWKLYYKNTPPEEQETIHNDVTTFHRVGFVGSKWKEVRNRGMARFIEAFAAGTATALNVTPQAVRIADYAVADDIVVDFYVTHPGTDTEEVIDAKLEQFDYQRVWDLYGIPSEADEQQRVVPCVMKCSNASRRTSPSSTCRLRMPGTNSVSQADSVCPRCQRQFSSKQEFLQPDESSGWNPQPMHSHTSSISDAVRTALMEDSYSAIRKPSPTPPLPHLAHRYAPHQRSEGQTSQQPSAHQTRGISFIRGAQMTPRVPWHTSVNNSLIPHPPRQRSLSNTTRYRQRRVNLRELESELSRKQRQHKHQERQQQLDREMRRSLNCSKLSMSTGPTINVSRSFLPPIPPCYTKVRTGPQHMKTGMGSLLE
ncbi:Flagellar Member 8 [Leishmania donovani]|uniref:Flagellar Member 8 n=1 Tax=Leishmania donovani TaxID=5661 RepID=A0A3S7X772_LEIDO|nr:Flagellar Member 8 [Leishmania donovani]